MLVKKSVVSISFVAILGLVIAKAEAADAPPAYVQSDADVTHGLGTHAVCSLELRVSPLNYASSESLNDVLVIEETFDQQVTPLKIIDSKTAAIELQRNLYVTQVSISTRDGRTLREALKCLGIYKGHLMLVARGCQ